MTTPTLDAIAATAATDLPTAMVEQAQRDILADIGTAMMPVAPQDVRSFADLHDHVDANELGMRCTPWDEPHEEDPLYSRFMVLSGQEQVDLLNQVQGRVDAWLRAGGHLPA